MIRLLASRSHSLVHLARESMGLFRFPLPDLGEKIKEGRVKKLYVKEGDRVEEFEKIADVESDKQFTEISAPESGLIKKLHYREDQICQVGDIFLEIETQAADELPKQTKPQVKAEAPRLEPQQQPTSEEAILTSPTVKIWALEHKVDLQQVKGSGWKGRILKDDIIHFIESRKAAQLKEPTKEKPLAAELPHRGRPKPLREVKKVTMTELQRVNYELAATSRGVPHLFFEQIFDVTELLTMAQGKNRVSLLSLLIKTFSMALAEHPKINSIYNPSHPFSYSRAAQQHLLLPRFRTPGSYSLIANLEKQSVAGIDEKLKTDPETSASKVEQMVRKATISISDVGETGVLALNPLVVGSTICHASVGGVRQVAVWRKGQARRQQVSVVVGGDHRVIDGASVARFTKAWRDFSESPASAFRTMI